MFLVDSRPDKMLNVFCVNFMNVITYINVSDTFCRLVIYLSGLIEHYCTVYIYNWLQFNSSLSFKGPSWSWSYGSWIYNYLCNQCLSPLKLSFWILLRRGALGTTLCDKESQWLGAGWWFSLGTLVSSTNKTDRHDDKRYAV